MYVEYGMCQFEHHERKLEREKKAKETEPTPKRSKGANHGGGGGGGGDDPNEEASQDALANDVVADTKTQSWFGAMLGEAGVEHVPKPPLQPTPKEEKVQKRVEMREALAEEFKLVLSKWGALAMNIDWITEFPTELAGKKTGDLLHPIDDLVRHRN